MPKYFATIAFVIEADNFDEGTHYAEQIAESPDVHESVVSTFVDKVEEVEDTDEDEAGEAWGSGLDEN